MENNLTPTTPLQESLFAAQAIYCLSLLEKVIADRNPNTPLNMRTLLEVVQSANKQHKADLQALVQRYQNFVAEYQQFGAKYTGDEPDMTHFEQALVTAHIEQQSLGAASKGLLHYGCKKVHSIQ